MVNILLEGYEINSDYLYDDLKKYILTDYSVAAFYELQSTQPQIKLEEASDLQLIKELETQVAILSGKYIDRNNIN